MNFEKWLKNNTESLKGRTVAVTGSTGGLGKALCRHLARLGAGLILVDRSRERSRQFGKELEESYGVSVRYISAVLDDIDSVKKACDELKKEELDFLVLNAGAYSIPRKTCESGYDNVFQINFLSPYYMTRELLPVLKKRGGTVVAVGSIAYGYSKTDANDVDFSARSSSALVYGNSKRYLAFSLLELFREEKEVHLAVTHPGISFTNITAHYPAWLFAIIKNPMKVIFMKPKKASLSILKGLFEDCSFGEWIGPRLFNVWGTPKKSKLRSCKREETAEVLRNADAAYNKMKNS